jgi:hypothetical protein
LVLALTGSALPEHYSVDNKDFMHILNSRDLDALFENQNVRILEKRAAGIFAMAGEEVLDQARTDPELWNLILNEELGFSKNPACLDCGANMIYVVRKL